MQIEVHHVDAEVAGARDAQDGVEVGAVAVDEAALRWCTISQMLGDVLLEQPERVRVRDHASAPRRSSAIMASATGLRMQDAVGAGRNRRRTS